MSALQTDLAALVGLSVARLHELFILQADGKLVWRVPHGRNKCRPAGVPVGCVGSEGYLLVDVEGCRYKNHQVIFAMTHGRWAKTGAKVDHINGDRLDNRPVNLRETSHIQNCWNSKKRKNNTSGFTGVRWHKTNKRWEAKIKQHGKCYHIGWFDDPAEAGTAYALEAVRLRGEYVHVSTKAIAAAALAQGRE